MKIIIANTLITALSGIAGNLAINIQGLRDTHPHFKKIAEKRANQYANDFKVSIEEARKKTSPQFPTESLVSVIKAKTLKLGSITKTDEGLEIEIKDQFLIESVDVTNQLLIKMLKPVADLIGVVGEHQIIVDQFNQRWNEDKVEVTSKVIDASQVPKSIHDPVVAASEWTVKESGPIKSPYFLDEENEKFIDLYYTTWVNSAGQELEVTPTTTRFILNSTESLLTTAQKEELPASLINTIRAHYNFTPLINVTVEEPTAETEVKEVKIDNTTPKVKESRLQPK